MNFTSPIFLGLFPVIIAGYAVFPKKSVWSWLLAASLLFYLYSSPRAMLVLLLIIGISYFGALKISKTREDQKRKWLFWSVISLCAVILLFFKYQKLPPVGISFYTFQAMSYVIDVYRGDLEAEEHAGYYALFISFFPQLVAGPIERTGNLLPQLKSMKALNQQNLFCGLEKMAKGFFKKLVVADFLAVFVDRVYGAANQVNGIAVILGTLLFAFQIYYDFSGYSDIACGAAAVFGIHLMENFESPYLAGTPRQFWRRWHISLTNWLTDYIYKPLGGSRKGILVQCRNIMLVFFCSGLWHGGTWNFCLWGLCHGFLVMAETLLEKYVGSPLVQPQKKWILALKQLGVFLLLCFPWIFFRAETFSDACCMIRNLGKGWSIEGVWQAVDLLQIRIIDVCQILLGLSCVKMLNEKRESFQELFLLINAIFLAWLFLLSQNGGNAFLYFQF